MKRFFIILLTILISGIFITAETIPTSTTDSSEFKEVKVYPLYRLPDKDVTIEWSTSSTDGITISYGDNKLIQTSEGKLVISSLELSSMPESFEITLKVNSKDGEEKDFKIETFNEPREIKLMADQEGFSERYLINFSDEEWDSDLVIENIELDNPKSYYIRNISVSMNYREIYTKWEYYNKERNISGYLRWDNQYKSNHDLPAAPTGTWTFRLWNYPWQHQNDEIQPVYFDPEIIFTVGAKEDL